jgi:hypothetical protein
MRVAESDKDKVWTVCMCFMLKYVVMFLKSLKMETLKIKF